MPSLPGKSNLEHAGHAGAGPASARQPRRAAPVRRRGSGAEAPPCCATQYLTLSLFVGTGTTLVPHASGLSRDFWIEEIKDFKPPPHHHPLSGGLNSYAHLAPPSSLTPTPDLGASATVRQLLKFVPAELPSLRKASASPLQAWKGLRLLLMAPPASSAHSASCPCPPAERRCRLLRTGFLPAGPYQGASPSQPAGLKACCGAEAGHASARSAPVPARERGPGRGGRSAGHSGRSCTPVRKILHAWSSGAGAQRQGTSGWPPKRPACLTYSKNSAKHGRRSPAGG